jgi:hypothetical protein
MPESDKAIRPLPCRYSGCMVMLLVVCAAASAAEPLLGQRLAMSKAAANGNQPVDRHVFFSREHREISRVGALSLAGIEGSPHRMYLRSKDDEDRIASVPHPGDIALAAG